MPVTKSVKFEQNFMPNPTPMCGLFQCWAGIKKWLKIGQGFKSGFKLNISKYYPRSYIVWNLFTIWNHSLVLTGWRTSHLKSCLFYKKIDILSRYLKMLESKNLQMFQYIQLSLWVEMFSNHSQGEECKRATFNHHFEIKCSKALVNNV